MHDHTNNNDALLAALYGLEARIEARDRTAMDPAIPSDDSETDWEPDPDLLRDIMLEREADREIERRDLARQSNGGDPHPGNGLHPPGKTNGRTPPSLASDIDTRAVAVTFFPNKSAQRQRCTELTLPRLAEQIRLKSGLSKLKLPWLKLIIFGDVRSPKGCLRTDANAKEVTGIEVEHDKGEIAFDTAITVMREAGIRSLLYTSPSYIPVTKERWRILLPLSNNLPPEKRAMLVARLNGLFGGKLAPESFTLSQAYLYGSVNDNPNHRVEVIDGDFVDLRPDLDQGAIGKTPEGEDAGHIPNGDQTAQVRTDAEIMALLELSREEGKWHISMRSATASMVGRGWTNAQIYQVTSPYCREGERDPDVEKMVEGARAKWNIPSPEEPDKSDDSDDGITLVPGVQVKFRDLNHRKKPKASLANAVIAIQALGIGARHDLFHNRIDVTYEGDAKTIREGLLTDDTISAVRSLINNTYKVDCGDNYTLAAIKEVARGNAFDPVLDMLDDFQAKWDGVRRLDSWVITYLGCEDTPLHRAIGWLTLVAACHRARVPGCKYDQITVLEGPEGINKSTAIRVLAGDDNFSDQSIIGADAKEVQEQLEGVWMHESADLAGMRKVEVEKVKTFARRQVDRARPAYGRVRENRPRRSTEWGTTNDDAYMLSQTGNRCFWPLKTSKIDIKALIRDRAQLLGEAAAYEAAGMSIVLDEKLWGAARVAQEQRRVPDPWEDILVDMPSSVIHRSDDGFERVASADVLKIVLQIQAAQQTSTHGQRLALAMKHIGWDRNPSGTVTISGQSERGYIRRSPPPRTKAELKAVKAEAEASAEAKARELFSGMMTDMQAEAWTVAKVEQLLSAKDSDLPNKKTNQ